MPPLSCTSNETIETIPNIRDAAGQNWNTFLTIVAPATASVTISDENTPTPTWTGNFTDNNYVEYCKRRQSLKYTYQNDLVDLLRKGKDIDNILNVKDGQHPLLLKQFFGKNVDIETMVILDSLFSYCKKWDRDIDEKIIWPQTKKLIKNYSSVLTFDREWYRIETIKIIKEYCDEK